MNTNSSSAHTLSVVVANKPGVLARIAHIFARRGFNIDSLVVSASMEGAVSRMTLTVRGDLANLQQIIEQVKKLIDVIHCTDHTGDDVVMKEMALVKVQAGLEARGEILQIADHFGAESLDLTETSLIVMATGDSAKLEAMLSLLKKFKIVELCRTGKVVMARGEKPT